MKIGNFVTMEEERMVRVVWRGMGFRVAQPGFEAYGLSVSFKTQTARSCHVVDLRFSLREIDRAVWDATCGSEGYAILAGTRM
jgi:hypothetical protein